MSPERVDRCVESLMKDPNFKPREGRTKEESAWALCNWLDQQGKLKTTNDGVKITMNKVEKLLTGPFKVVLPITGARRQVVEKAEGGEEIQLWLHVEASGKERDLDGDRFSEAGLTKMVEYAEKDQLNFLDGHYRDLMAAVLGDIHNPYLTEEKHFAFDVLLNSETNPFASQLFSDVLAGKRYGASIAGVVHDAEIEEYSEGEFGQIFNDVELIEVSRTSWPSWRDSFITLLASKVGKLPQAEFESIMKRRDALLEGTVLLGPKERFLKSLQPEGERKMLVRTVDDGAEEWEENKDGDLVAKITSPHGWDKKFSVSNAPWSGVKDRSKPCQYAIVKKNEDGSFSSSKSGYPHHMPGCTTINRGGVIAAAGRLVQALKSCVLALETPPMISLVSERIGEEEFILYKQGKFTTEELKYAARHILRHYRQDMDAEPPENLVDVAKTYEDETEEIIDLIRGLVRAIEKSAPHMEEKEMSDEKKVVETPEEQEPTEVQQLETATETEPAKVEPVDKQETEKEIPEVVSEPVAVVEEEKASELEKKADSQGLDLKFGNLIFVMQEVVKDAVQRQELEEAKGVLNDFAKVGADILTKLVEGTQTDMATLSFLEPFEKRIELATGRQTKSRVIRRNAAIDVAVKELRSLQELDKSADTIDDTAVVQVVQAKQDVERVKEEKSELEKRLDAIEARQKDESAKMAADQKAKLDKMAAALETPKREEPADSDDPAPVVELSREEQYRISRDRFVKSTKKR